MDRLMRINGLKKYTIVRGENRFVVAVENGKKMRHALIRNAGGL